MFGQILFIHSNKTNRIIIIKKLNIYLWFLVLFLYN